MVNKFEEINNLIKDLKKEKYHEKAISLYKMILNIDKSDLTPKQNEWLSKEFKDAIEYKKKYFTYNQKQFSDTMKDLYTFIKEFKNSNTFEGSKIRYKFFVEAYDNLCDNLTTDEKKKVSDLMVTYTQAKEKYFKLEGGYYFNYKKTKEDIKNDAILDGELSGVADVVTELSEEQMVKIAHYIKEIQDSEVKDNRYKLNIGYLFKYLDKNNIKAIAINYIKENYPKDFVAEITDVYYTIKANGVYNTIDEDNTQCNNIYDHMKNIERIFVEGNTETTEEEVIDKNKLIEEKEIELQQFFNMFDQMSLADIMLQIGNYLDPTKELILSQRMKAMLRDKILEMQKKNKMVGLVDVYEDYVKRVNEISVFEI